MAENHDILDQISGRYFAELEYTVPYMQQSLFDLQNEYYKIWKNATTANTTLYKEFLCSLGCEFPEAAKDAMKSMGEETLKLCAMYSKLAISNIETAKDAAKRYNENAGAFVELNQKITGYWPDAFLPQKQAA